MCWKLIAAFCVCSCYFPLCYAQGATPVKEGSITGVVLTEDSQLALGSKVCIATRQGNTTSISCNVATNDEARFTIDHIKPGTLELFAVKDDEGYSINNQVLQAVTISPDQLWQDVTLHLRNRWGVIAAFVTDKMTGKPIRGATVEYVSPDGCVSGSFLLDTGSFRTVPPDCEVVVIVTANGYRGWVYTDPENPSRPVLKIKAGEQKKLEVQLEPVTEKGRSQTDLR